jgi:putative DNA primase/helicase
MAKDDVAAAVQAAPAWRPKSFDESDPLDYRLGWLPRNDAGNAERLLTRYGQDLIYVADVGWHWWDGKRWSYEHGLTMANRLAHETVRCIYDECTSMQDQRGEKAVLPKMIEDHFKWAAVSGNSQRMSAMLTVAQHYCTRRPSDLDANPLLLNLANGTLDLTDSRCETVRPHDRDDLITKIINIDFDPVIRCPEFLKFMKDILPDQEVINFLQRSFGYSLTGDISEQCLWFFYGTGANGKSTLVNVMARILGPYSMNLPFSSLVADDRKRGSEASPDLARLPGARMVRASEPEKGAKLGEAVVKLITGEEEMTARHLNHGFFDFMPQFKLFLSGNHRPTIRGQDEGIWRRIRLVPFTVSIPKENRDQKLGEKLWAERAGILAWMVEGYLHWQYDGLNPPEAVLAATGEYREDSDPLGLFLGSWTERVEQGAVQGKRLYEAYALWCQDNAVEPMSNTLFGRMLTERGFSKDRSGVVTYRGIQLSQEAVDALDQRDRRRHAKKGGDDD